MDTLHQPIENGYCDRCSAAIEIPGLDGSRCPNCGWIDNSKVVLAPPQPQTVKADTPSLPPKPPLPKLPRSKPSSQPKSTAPSQISLLAGGER